MLSEDQGSSEEPDGPCAVWKYRCSVARCPYRTNRPYNLWRHEESHSNPIESKLYGCPVCVYSTDKVSNLKRHMSSKHPGAKDRLPETPPLDRTAKIQCQVMGCRYETNRPYDLKRHIMVHNNPEKSHRTYKCSLCTYSSDRKANLKRHHELRHSGIEEAIQTAEELRQELLMEEQMLKEQKLKDQLLEKQNLKDRKLKEQEQNEQKVEDQIVEIQIMEDHLECKDIQLRSKVKVPPALPKSKENLFSSLMEDLVGEEQTEDYVYEPVQKEQPPLITISTCKPQIFQGDINNKQVIAVNVNGQLRWFQSIDPPPGAPTNLELAVDKHAQQEVIAQQQMDELDDELALSLAEQDQQEEFLVEMLTEEKQSPAEKPDMKGLTWSWSTPHGVHHISTAKLEDQEFVKESKTDDTDADFPDWWDDGKYTKMNKNEIFRNQPRKPTQANVQRILRIIYDVYYKPFKEDRKQFETFQIKDSWLCATRMTRMQIIKDMYSKQGT
ncbi:RE1-silencing transcription factor [Drosophila rhopaloa]|uniref:RE1-silencing transcription factor n=1 Tax=Drosophila rhopaloa TaxID=1041015 RepID=A0A6P4EDR1_DRORH|nr:RE1-silencing transcription factor [Drosophila rhopaloa]